MLREKRVRSSKQTQLLFCLRHVHPTTPSPILSADPIFLPQTRHQPRQPLRVSLWQKRAVCVTLAIKFDQGREVLFQKRKKHRRRARLQKERVGIYVLCSGGVSSVSGRALPCPGRT